MKNISNLKMHYERADWTNQCQEHDLLDGASIKGLSDISIIACEMLTWTMYVALEFYSITGI